MSIPLMIKIPSYLLSLLSFLGRILSYVIDHFLVLAESGDQQQQSSRRSSSFMMSPRRFLSNSPAAASDLASPSSAPMSTGYEERKREILQLWTKELNEFNHEKAKEIMVIRIFYKHVLWKNSCLNFQDKEKEALKSALPRWSRLFSILSTLSQAERHYFAFAFLQPKGFLRKDVSGDEASQRP